MTSEARLCFDYSTFVTTGHFTLWAQTQSVKRSRVLGTPNNSRSAAETERLSVRALAVKGGGRRFGMGGPQGVGSGMGVPQQGPGAEAR